MSRRQTHKEENLALIKRACRDKDSFLGISTTTDDLPKIPWSSEPAAIAEIWRWMEANKFSARSAQKDCAALYDMFNLGPKSSVYTPDHQQQLRTALFERMRDQELPYFVESGLLDGQGHWNQAAVKLWTRCDWDPVKIRKETTRRKLDHMRERTLPELKEAMDTSLSDLALQLDKTTADILKTVQDKHGPHMAAVDAANAGPAIDDLLRDIDGLHMHVARQTDHVFRAVKLWAIEQSHARCLGGELGEDV